MKDPQERFYQVTIRTNENGSIAVARVNQGINPYELLGLLEHAKQEVLMTLAGKIKPDLITRTYVKDEPEKTAQEPAEPDPQRGPINI